MSFAPPGFVSTGPYTLYRGWCDSNTLGVPALFIEVRDQVPYDEARVRYYRWMYNHGPHPAIGVPVVHADDVAPPVPVAPPEFVMPPPAPPVEEIVPPPVEPSGVAGVHRTLAEREAAPELAALCVDRSGKGSAERILRFMLGEPLSRNCVP